MSWTTPKQLREQLQKQWDRGALLACALDDAPRFPLRLTLKGPSAKDMVERFSEVQMWVKQISSAEGYTCVLRSFSHRILGAQTVPHEIWVDTLEGALGILGKKREMQAFIQMRDATMLREPSLLPWLARRPLSALSLAGEWERLLRIVTWMKACPRPNIYLRQVDIEGVHSKFIESHKGVLAELLDLALDPEHIDWNATGGSGFCRRYGFLEKPTRFRFRILDPALRMTPKGGQDITLDAESFETLPKRPRRVFITENEINFLAFPKVADSIVMFGSGYSIGAAGAISWLQDCDVYYWGDLDTDGFSILHQLRQHVPHARSIMMDRETLMRFSAHWTKDQTPQSRMLSGLTIDEMGVYEDLKNDALGQGVRLEQERIGFEWVKLAIDAAINETQETPGKT